MHLTTVVLGCFLLGQAPDAMAASAPGGAALETEPARRDINRRLAPPEMVAEALEAPAASRLSGRPLTLLAALSATADRRQQLEVAHAYWRLVEAAALYHFCLNYDGQLQGLQAGEDGAPLLRMARASSAAALHEAEVAAVAAQHELAALVLFPPDARLPLPADRPHVGPYLTRFDKLSSVRALPARAKLIDQTLPLRRRAFEQRALAVEAAEAVVVAATDGQADLSAVLPSMRQAVRQQQAFVRSVCRYNDNIADYALAVAGPAASPQDLVKMLIKPVRQPGGESAVQPAGHTGPVPTPAQRPGKDAPAPARRAKDGRTKDSEKNVPTPAPPRELPRDLDTRSPLPASGWAPSGSGEPTLAPPREETEPADHEEPTFVPSRDETESDESEMSGRPMVPVEPKPKPPTQTTVNKPVADARSSSETPPPVTRPSPLEEGGGESSSTPTPAALYPALVDAQPGVRSKQLAQTLHRDRTLPEGIGEPISLSDCLQYRAGGDRRSLIAAYWLARQRAAQYQVFAQRAQWLQGLAPKDARQMFPLQLRSARLEAKAVLHEAHVALLEAQFDLATRVGRVWDPLWPMPNTVPHTGRYLLKLESQPRRLVDSWPLRRLAAMIPSLAESVQQRAAAVVEADAARAAATASYRAGSQPLELVLAGIDRQADQTLAFLQTLSDYNQAIAEYALTVLPPETPAGKLVAALVVIR